jgi:hypothetical protein
MKVSISPIKHIRVGDYGRVDLGMTCNALVRTQCLAILKEAL